MSGLDVVILAAGEGKRMRSALPKVLHRLAGQTLLGRVVRTAESLNPRGIHVVVGHGGTEVREALSELEVSWAEQTERLGTGHAVEQAMPAVPDESTVLVLFADVPLIRDETLLSVLRAVEKKDRVGLITVEVADPTGYGRIIRTGEGVVIGIVEDRDATDEQRRINEINTGIMAAPADRVRRWLREIDADNSQGEYYLTDIIALAVRDGLEVSAVQATTAEEVLGVNDRTQLACLERYFQRCEAERLMKSGVTLMDPGRLDIRGQVTVGQDVVIDVNVVLEGNVSLADGVVIGPNTTVKDSEVGPGTEILANCVIEDASIGPSCRIGPYSRVRPGTRLASDVHIGNFVEIKKSRISSGTKVNHLSYVGDSELGSRVNVGAGTITCNYDGANKHRTIVGDDSFIGSGTELVAPVTIGDGSTIGAGSTITRDTEPGALTLTRSEQVTVRGWKRPTKK